MPPELVALVADNGPLLFFAVGFFEFIGAPVAGVPILVAGGALAAAGTHGSALPLMAATAAGGLTADAALFGLTRWKGQAMVDAACGLSSNPRSCIFAVTERLTSVGGRFVLVAKFVPGAGNLVAPAAAMARMSLVRFLTYDLVALSLWASVYTAVGWGLSEEVGAVLTLLAGYGAWTVGVGLALVAGAGFWRLLKVRRHTRGHQEMRAVNQASG